MGAEMAKMGRPPSAAPKTVIGHVRLTKGEEAALKEHWGSVPRALRAMVNGYLARPPAEVSVAADDPTPVIEVAQPVVADHRHRRGVELEPTWQGGSKIKRFACATPGCQEVLS